MDEGSKGRFDAGHHQVIGGEAVVTYSQNLQSPKVRIRSGREFIPLVLSESAAFPFAPVLDIWPKLGAVRGLKLEDFKVNSSAKIRVLECQNVPGVGDHQEFKGVKWEVNNVHLAPSHVCECSTPSGIGARL